MCLDPHQLRVSLAPLNMFKASRVFTDSYKAVLLLWILLVIYVSCLSFYNVMFVPCGLVITCWERADVLALLCLMFPCVFAIFPYDV